MHQYDFDPLVGGRFLNLLLTKLSRDFKLRGMSTTRISKDHISVLLEATVTWSGTHMVVLYVLCMLI